MYKCPKTPTQMSETESGFHQLVKKEKKDYRDLEKKQWEAIIEWRVGEQPRQPQQDITAEFTRRWHACGENFPFPEAAPIVFTILEKIKKHTLLNSTLELSKKLILQEVMSIDNTTESIRSSNQDCPEYAAVVHQLKPSHIDYPLWPETNHLQINTPSTHTYITPYNGMPFPYASTMRWIARAMDFLDLVYFSENASESKPLQGLYFRDRFRYYYDYMLAEAPKVFLFPTCTKIGATNLLTMGCSALQPLGIEWHPVFVDEYLQSPCNFFWHDLNHARRIHQHNQQIVANLEKDINFKNISNKYIAWDMMYEDQHKVCYTLMQSCNRKNKYGKLIKMILFEVVHEDAIPWNWQWIWDDILLPDGNCFPYESTVPGIHRKTVKYYAKSAPMLATFYNKMRHEFFEEEFGKEYIVQVEYRTLEHITTAVLELLSIIQKNIEYNLPDREMVEKLILSQQYCEAKHTLHPLKLVPDLSFQRAALCMVEKKSIQNCSFVPNASTRLSIYMVATAAASNPQLCSKNRTPNSVDGHVDPSASILVTIANKSTDAIGDGEFKIIRDRTPALLPSDTMTSNGPNGVLVQPGSRINLFSTDDATTATLLRKYIHFRNKNKRAIFDLAVDQMRATDYDYTLAAEMLRDIGNSEHFDSTIGLCSFCQTWATSENVGLPQFSVESPHFQNRIFIRNAEHLDNVEQIVAYMSMVNHHDDILEQMGCAGAIKTFVNLDILVAKLV